MRELRRRCRWTQTELGKRAGLSQQAISLVERGHGWQLSIATMSRAFAALDARFEPMVSWRGGDLDRLLDSAHAAVVSAIVQRLRDADWAIAVEVSYSEFGERGSIDVLAGRRDLMAVLVVEAKSELVSVEATTRKLDEKARLVQRVIGQKRFGFQPRSIGRVLVLPSTTAARRRVRDEHIVLDVAFPCRGAAVREWLRHPEGEVAGVAFVPITNASGDKRARVGAKRVRGGREGEPERASVLSAGFVARNGGAMETKHNLGW